MKTRILIITAFLSVTLAQAKMGQHPCLSITPQGVKEIRASMGKNVLFDQSFQELKKIADSALKEEIVVPVPKDAGGGYTHEKHKNNYYEMNAAGTLYQLTGNTKYAGFVRDMLMKYAELYPTLGMHPVVKSDVTGKLFWQTLNDAVWLVYTAQAYDCVYDFMSAKDRSYVEKNLFYPMAEFISNGNPKNNAVFNKMHNHGTWSLAAVGMIGYVMGDQSLVDKALYGSNKDGKSGFIKQLDVLFSPDGYYTEGPYYQRYAILPFMTFAQAIQNQQPDIRVFDYRNGILFKAVNAVLQCAYQGELFYLNDALAKNYQTQELVCAVDIAYKNNPSQVTLLDIARQQKSFMVSDAGLVTAKALEIGKIRPFEFPSILLRDGQNGNEGGIAILRTGMEKNQTCLVYKATSHGLSHGHFDKLSLVLYDNGNNILQDYGAARFLNIEPKNGGQYTRENESWAMQTIAHNTVTIDEKSDFNGNMKISSLHHPVINYFDGSNSKLQVVSATDSNAYEGVKMQRTSALVNHPDFRNPFVLDVFRIQSGTEHTLDLPFYYLGQMVSTDFPYRKNTNYLQPLGKENGYQHLWLEATGKTGRPNACFTWFNGNRFYSITVLTDSSTQILMTRIGAKDPDFNLRNDPGFMIRQPHVKNHTFVSVVEPHGLYELNREVTMGYESAIKSLEILKDDVAYTAVRLETKEGKTYLFIQVNSCFDAKAIHSLVLNGRKITFTGNAFYTEFIQ